MRGDERRSDWYCRCSWVLRVSGGLCEGGCVGGKRWILGAADAIGGAGVVAVAREA